jgi:hypothetical protein
MSEPWHERWEDNREMMDIEPAEPLGRMPVTFDVAIPSVEQVTGEIARQFLASAGYNHKATWTRAVDDALHDLITRMIEERARPVIDELLERPLRPTDAFGNPQGEPTTLSAVLAKRVTEWRDDIVDSAGKPGKPDRYSASHYSTRLERLIKDIVDGQLANNVSAETRKIVQDMKNGATQLIAKKIAERLEGMVFR